MDKTYDELLTVLDEVTMLEFDSPDQIKGSKRFLREMQRGHVVQRILEAKADSSAITKIYDDFLRGFFSKLRLSDEEAHQIKDLFDVELRNWDKTISEALHSLGYGLPQIADEMLRELREESVDTIKLTVQLLEDAWEEPRKRLRTAMITLRELQTKF